MVIDWKQIGKQSLLVLIIAVLAVLCLAIGLVIGYSVLGDGSNPWSILSLDKWQTIIDQFTGK